MTLDMLHTALQSRINATIASPSTDKVHKRTQLRDLLDDANTDIAYVDLDDTLLAESSALSTRFIICAVVLRWSRERIAKILPRFARLNDDFVAIHKKNKKSYVVLTRNNHWLANAVVEHIQAQCQAHDISICAVIGSDYTTDWRLMSRDKYVLMPQRPETIFITDNAEHHDDARPGTIIITPGLPHLPLFAKKVRIGLLTLLSGLLSRMPYVPSIQQRADRQ